MLAGSLCSAAQAYWTYSTSQLPTTVLRLQGANLKDGVHMQLGGTHGGEVCVHASADDLTPVR